MMYLRWLISAVFSVLLTLVTWFISPILALHYFVTVENGREWLVKPLRWFQSFDNPLDEWWMAKPNNYCDNGKCTWLDWDFTKPFHRYLGRLFWLCRNPAYGFAQFAFGVEPIGNIKFTHKNSWDCGKSNWEFTRWDNAFQYREQLFVTKNIYLRLQIGWKPHKGFSRFMLATFLLPLPREWK